MTEIPAANSNDLFAVRLAKLQEMRAAGFDPFHANVSPTHSSVEAIAAYVDGQDYVVPVTVAGRITVFRDGGKSCFIKILDRAGTVQLFVKKDQVGEAAYVAFKKLDLGDIIGATGTMFRTRAGEVTVRVDKYTLVSKALRPLPEKWHGLADPEQVYRQRYLDLIVNQESRERLKLRARLVSAVRRFFEGRGFLEVETPILQNVAGGAAARPFTTHHNALGCDFFLRIALELYLKRLLVGGFERVFEIGRNFRNEGIDRRHNPEFTMLEVYQAYSDYRGMMQLVRDLIQTLCRDVLGKMEIVHAPTGETIKFDGEWKQARYKDLIVAETGDPEWFSRTKEQKMEKARAMGLEIHPGWEDHEVTNEVYGKRIECRLIQPTFVTHLPKELCPLAKITADDPTTIDVFELVIGGMEVAPAYSEQNDPLVQRQMFEAQVGEEIQKLDNDFLTALEHGMPPAGGMGIGIDRLCILLTGAASIRDVIFFPQLRPQGVAPTKAE